jgi:hypothetical protein
LIKNLKSTPNLRKPAEIEKSEILLLTTPLGLTADTRRKAQTLFKQTCDTRLQSADYADSTDPQDKNFLTGLTGFHRYSIRKA